MKNFPIPVDKPPSVVVYSVPMKHENPRKMPWGLDFFRGQKCPCYDWLQAPFEALFATKKFRALWGKTRKGGQYQKTYFWAHCFQGFRETVLHAIHTACGIETSAVTLRSLNIFPLHAIHTACGIETRRTLFDTKMISAIACNPYRLRYWNMNPPFYRKRTFKLHAIHTACGIETHVLTGNSPPASNCMQSIPLAVLKQCSIRNIACRSKYCMQSIPLAVLKLVCHDFSHKDSKKIACNPYRLRYWNPPCRRTS